MKWRKHNMFFRKDRSNFDLIFTLRNMMEKTWEFKKYLVMTFIDIEKTYQCTTINVGCIDKKENMQCKSSNDKNLI